MHRLIVNPDTDNAWEISLQPGVISLGRGPENNVPLDHASISDEHCLLTVTDAGVVVKDLGSARGTLVNDLPVDETVLQSGQVLRLGDVVLRFEADSNASVETPAPAADSVSAAAVCKFHPKAIAHFHCPQCGRDFCELCVNIRQGRGFCRACSVECEPLKAPAISNEAEPPFLALARGAFSYPFKGDGLMLLLTGTAFFLLIDGAEFVLKFMPGYGWFVLALLVVFGTGYLTAYLRQILTGTAMGEEKMPDWPEFTGFDSVTSPFFQLIGTVVFSFGPAIGLTVYAALVREGAPSWLGWATTTAMVFGCAYFPMAFLAVAIFDSIGAVNPMLVVPTILKIPLEYLFSVGLFAVILFIRWLCKTFLPEILPVPLLPAILFGLLGLYLLTVEVRILGLLYWARKGEMGWFKQ